MYEVGILWTTFPKSVLWLTIFGLSLNVLDFFLLRAWYFNSRRYCWIKVVHNSYRLKITSTFFKKINYSTDTPTIKLPYHHLIRFIIYPSRDASQTATCRHPTDRLCLHAAIPKPGNERNPYDDGGRFYGTLNQTHEKNGMIIHLNATENMWKNS